MRATEVQQQPSVAVCARSGGIAGAVEGSRPQWRLAPAVAVCVALAARDRSGRLARFSDRKRATTMVVLAMMMMMMVVVVVVLVAMVMVMMMKMVIVVVAAIMIVVIMMMRA